MDKRAKKAISKNRVRILGLDYFDLTGPLLAAESLPIKKHKDIKTEAQSNKARIDLLLEWIDESAPTEAFPQFLQGIRNCQENMLAKKIKKDAAEGGLIVPSLTKKMVMKPKPLTPLGPGAIPILGAPGDKPKPKSPKPKTPKVKKEGDGKPEIFKGPSGLGTLTLPFNGLESLLPLPVGMPAPGGTPQSRKRKSGADKPKTPKTGSQNGTPKQDDTKVVTKSAPTPKETSAKPKKPQGVKIKLPKPPRVTRKSSSDRGDDPEKKPKVVKKKADGPSATSSGGPAAPKSPKANAKAKIMSFKEVENKQQDSRQKFKFKNVNAVVKIVHFKDKTDISYLGCPFEESGKVCEKKVELKSKEFVCESRHKSPNCKQIPRLYITCNDGTADLQLTLLKKNVELFCGKSSTELGTISIGEIKEALDTTVGKNFAVEVQCDKNKKAAKKSGKLWNNLASILTNPDDIGDDAPAAKKKRKN